MLSIGKACDLLPTFLLWTSSPRESCLLLAASGIRPRPRFAQIRFCDKMLLCFSVVFLSVLNGEWYRGLLVAGRNAPKNCVFMIGCVVSL